MLKDIVFRRRWTSTHSASSCAKAHAVELRFPSTAFRFWRYFMSAGKAPFYHMGKDPELAPWAKLWRGFKCSRY